MGSNQVPPPPAIPCPGRSATFGEVWKYLEAGIEHIMIYTPPSTSGLPAISYLPFDWYTSMYATVYTCSSIPSSSDRGGLGSQSTADDIENKPSVSHLYTGLENYFDGRVEIIYWMRFPESRAPQGTALLEAYAMEWDRYNVGAGYVNNIFTYLNQYWVKYRRNQGFNTTYRVHTLALAKWRDHIFQKMQPKLTTALINLAIQHPTNGSREGVLAKIILDSYISLGFKDEDPSKECLDVYTTCFEQPFLETLGLGPEGATTPVTDNAVLNYIAWATARFANGELGQGYLRRRTEEALKRSLRTA